MQDGFEQEQQDEGEGGWDPSALADAAYDDGDATRAELEAAHERAAHAELDALVQRHPELTDEQNAAQLVERAATVAGQYGLSPDAATDPRWLSLVADNGLGAEQQDPEPDPWDTVAALDQAQTTGRRALGF
jgi:hypothetical protein